MILYRVVLLLIAAQLIYLSADAQSECSYTFAGRIVDESDKPLIGATIIMDKGKLGTAADVSGDFELKNICPGRHRFKIQFLGYEDRILDIDVQGDRREVIQLKAVVTELREVVVQHHDALHTEHATNFFTLDEKKLSEAAGKTLGESLKEVTGVSVIQSGPGIYKPVIHGLHSNRVLILNDGIRHEAQQWGAEHAPEIDPLAAANIVVIKDASAIKYGADPLGGVIIVNPPDLPERAGLGGTVQTVLQSNGRGGTIAAMLEGGIPKRNGWGWRIQGTTKQLGDFHTPSYTLTNTGAREINYSATTGYHRELRGIDISFSHFQTDIGILKGASISSLEDLANAMERDVPLQTSSFSYTIDAPRQAVDHNLIKVNSHMTSRIGELKMQYGFQNNHRREFDARMGELENVPALNLQLNTHTITTEWESPHSHRGTISAGFNAMHQMNKSIFGTQRIAFIPNFLNTSAGVYGLAKIIANKWVIDIGTRVDVKSFDVAGYDFRNNLYEAKHNFGDVSATVGATWKGENDQFNLNISRAWRPPHVAELYSLGTHQSAAAIEFGLLLDDSTNAVIDTKPFDVKTEDALKLVASYSKHSKAFSLQVGPYVNYISNYIFLRPEGVTRTIRGVYPYFRYTQTDALCIGSDMSAKLDLSSSVTLLSSASLLQIKDMQFDNKFIFVPSNRYEIGARYHRDVSEKIHDFYFDAKVRYVDRQRNAPRVVTVREIIESEENGDELFLKGGSNFDFMKAPEGYFLANVSLGFSFKQKAVQYDLRASCENLFNERYRDYTNRFRYFSDDLGRNMLISVKCIF